MTSTINQRDSRVRLAIDTLGVLCMNAAHKVVHSKVQTRCNLVRLHIMQASSEPLKTRFNLHVGLNFIFRQSTMTEHSRCVVKNQMPDTKSSVRFRTCTLRVYILS